MAQTLRYNATVKSFPSELDQMRIIRKNVSKACPSPVSSKNILRGYLLVFQCIAYSSSGKVIFTKALTMRIYGPENFRFWKYFIISRSSKIWHRHLGQIQTFIRQCLLRLTFRTDNHSDVYVSMIRPDKPKAFQEDYSLIDKTGYRAQSFTCMLIFKRGICVPTRLPGSTDVSMTLKFFPHINKHSCVSLCSRSQPKRPDIAIKSLPRRKSRLEHTIITIRVGRLNNMDSYISRWVEYESYKRTFQCPQMMISATVLIEPW